MNIGVNSSYIEAKRTGIARLTINLLNEWKTFFPENNYYLYFRKIIPDDKFLAEGCFINKLVNDVPFLKTYPVWENLPLAAAISHEKKLDIFFSPSYTLPLFLSCKKRIVYIFDISAVSHPEWFPSRTRYYYRFSISHAVKNSDKIITGSYFSKKEILLYFNVKESKIKVVYPGIGERFGQFHDEQKICRVKELFSSGRDYILYVGYLIQRRNVRTLIEAFKKNILDGNFNYSLVIVGPNHTHPYIDINRLISELGLENKVFWYQHIDDYKKESYLPSLYSGASLFIYPSCYEGFGIPPLEALASGTPVITANLSSLPEVVGKAAYLLNDPSSVNEMADAMKLVLFDQNLKNTLVVRGLEQAKKFSWQRCAREIMETF